MTYSILAANDKLYLSEYIPGDNQLIFTTARSKALRFSPEERSHMEELMYLYDLHELRMRKPIVNASDPFGAYPYQIGDLIDNGRYFSPSPWD